MYGLRNTYAKGELGADAGVVSGLFTKRADGFEALDEGREMGRRVGVKNMKGTPAISSRCLCIRSKTCCSSYEDKISPLDEHIRGI